MEILEHQLTRSTTFGCCYILGRLASQLLHPMARAVSDLWPPAV